MYLPYFGFAALPPSDMTVLVDASAIKSLLVIYLFGKISEQIYCKKKEAGFLICFLRFEKIFLKIPDFNKHI
mgnify:CR=1 FL=1